MMKIVFIHQGLLDNNISFPVLEKQVLTKDTIHRPHEVQEGRPKCGYFSPS